MRGEDLERAFVAYTGMAGDRIYAFVDPRARPAFPWLSARELHELVQWKPRFVAGPDPSELYPSAERFRVEVEDPQGQRRPIDHPDVLAEVRRRSGREVWLRHSEKGMPDGRPVSLVGLDTVEALGRETGAPVDPLRFRANLYVRWHSQQPFFEDELVGRTLIVGKALELMVSKRDSRCSIVNIDPESAAVEPSILRAIARQHENCFGVYCVVLREGVVHQGDALSLR
jgi:hypothetical protein